jgi:hypothetical protein
MFRWNSLLPSSRAKSSTCWLLRISYVHGLLLALKMEAVCSSNTSVNIYRTTRRHIAFHIHRCENLKPKKICFHFPAGAKDFPFFRSVQTGFGTILASFSVVTEGSSPRVKRAGREADQSSPASSKFKKMWIYTFASPYVFIA